MIVGTFVVHHLPSVAQFRGPRDRRPPVGTLLRYSEESQRTRLSSVGTTGTTLDESVCTQYPERGTREMGGRREGGRRREVR